jgi:hypothetical protein
MPELNFKITGDDSELKKTLAGIAKIAKENSDKIQKEIGSSIDAEVKGREKATEATKKQKTASDDVVKSTNEEAKATDRATEAIKRKNAAFDANGRQIRPVQISNSQDEINAAKSGSVGTVTGGTVVGSSAEWNRLSSEAAGYGVQAKKAYNEAVTGANSNTQAVQNAQKAIRSLKIELQSYQNIADSSTDSKRLSEYNNKVRETQAEIARLRNVGKAGFDELGNKITGTAGKIEILNAKLKMYNEGLLKARAPQSFVNLNQKIEETSAEIGRLQNAGKKGFDEMGNAVAKSSIGVGKLWTGLKYVAAALPGIGIAGLLAFAVEPIMNYLSSLDLFKKQLTDAQKEQAKLNDAMSSSEYANAAKNVNELRINIGLAKEGILSKSSVVKEYNETIGKTTGQVKNLNEAEQGLIRNADAYLKMTLMKAAAQLALEDAAKEAYKAEQIREKGRATISNPNDISGYENLTIGERLKVAFEQDAGYTDKVIINAANRESRQADKLTNDRTKIADKFQADAAAIAKKYKFNFFATEGDKVPKTPVDPAIKQQESLQKRIDEINAEYTRKSATKDESELQAIRDKFKRIADEAAKFNADPKNKLHLVDTSKLTETRDQAISDLQYRQTTEKVKIELDKQKGLYAEYEEYKTRLGKDAADEHRLNDNTVYNLTLEENKRKYDTYLEYLEAGRAKLLTKDPTQMNGAELERLHDYDKRIQDEVNAEQKKYDALVKEFMTYSQQRKVLMEKYNADFATLEGNPEAQAARTLRYQEDLKSLDDNKVQTLDAYKRLFEGIDRLSDENAAKVIYNAKNMLDTLTLQGKVSKEMADQIRKLITDTEKALKDRMPDRLINLANQIDNLASSVSKVDEGFGKMLSTVGNVVGQVGNIKKGMADLKAASGKGDMLSALGAGLGVFGAGFSIISSLEGLFDRSAEREAQRSYSAELQSKQLDAINSALERQVALINDAYGTDRLLKYSEALSQIAKDTETYQAKLSGKIVLTGDKGLDDEIAKYNAGIATAYDKEFRNNPVFTRLSENTPLGALQDYLDNGKLDDATAKIVENLIKVKQQAVDLQNALNAENIGSSLSEIADDFVSKLTDGTQDFGKSFEDIIRKSILNGFKGKLIQQQLQGFYDQFSAATADSSLSPEEIEKLRSVYMAAAEKAKKDLADLAAATGIDLDDPDSGSKTSALQKNITQITSDQANALEGISRGSYDYLKVLAMLQTTGNATAMQILDASMQGVRWQQQTAENTGIMIQRMDSQLTELKTIAKNSASSGTSLRGSGNQYV